MILPDPGAAQTPAQAEALLDRVLSERGMGLVSDSELRALLPRLRWRDAQGGRFTLGVNSRTWHAWDGIGWAPSAPAATLWIDLDPEAEPDVDPASPLEPVVVAAPVTERWTPTHHVPDGGMAAYSMPDAASPAEPLDGKLAVALLERRGDWAYVECSNGWKTWVDGRLLV